MIHSRVPVFDYLCSFVVQALKSKHASQYIAGGGGTNGDYQLDVDVSGLIFSHHPLFSREHVLGARLAQLYDQHLSRQHKNITEHLTTKVKHRKYNDLYSNSIWHKGYSAVALTLTYPQPTPLLL